MTPLNLRQTKFNSARIPKKISEIQHAHEFSEGIPSLRTKLYPQFSEEVRNLWRVIIQADQATTYNNCMNNTKNVTQI